MKHGYGIRELFGPSLFNHYFLDSKTLSLAWHVTFCTENVLLIIHGYNFYVYTCLIALYNIFDITISQIFVVTAFIYYSIGNCIYHFLSSQSGITIKNAENIIFVLMAKHFSWSKLGNTASTSFLFFSV